MSTKGLFKLSSITVHGNFRGHLASGSQMLFYWPILNWLCQNHLGIFQKGRVLGYRINLSHLGRGNGMCVLKKLSGWFQCIVWFENHPSSSAHASPPQLPHHFGLKTFRDKCISFQSANCSKIPSDTLSQYLPPYAFHLQVLSFWTIQNKECVSDVQSLFHIMWQAFKCLAPRPVSICVFSLMILFPWSLFHPITI